MTAIKAGIAPESVRRPFGYAMSEKVALTEVEADGKAQDRAIDAG